MSKVERVARGARAGKADQVLAAVEAGLTPFMKACLAKIHGAPNFVPKENMRRKELRKKGSKVPNLKSDASSSAHWDYAEILKTLSSLWPQFDSHIDQMIALRNRGAGHRYLGPFTDEDLSDLCKYAEQLLRATGVTDEADFVREVFPQYAQLAKSDSSILPTCLSVEEFLDKAGPIAGSPKPVSRQIVEKIKTRDGKTPNVSLSLKSRGIEDSAPLQSFSHGPTKRVVVDKVRTRGVATEQAEMAATPAVPTTPDGKTPSVAPIKKLPLGSRGVEQSIVRQNFNHGRTKVPFVEKVKKR
jgi:hypothetical protein